MTLLYTKFFELSIMLNHLYQSIYNKIIFKVYSITSLRVPIIYYHTFLFYFRYYSIMFGLFVEKYISLNMLAIVVSIILSRLHLAGYLIMGCLLFIQLDFAVLNMLRFFKKYPEVLHTHFPQIRVARRGMWTQAARTINEAASNPQVQAMGVAVAGALVWKAIDVYDTHKAGIIAEADRVAEAAQREADRVAEAAQREADRVAEAVQREADRIAEAAQNEANRIAEATQHHLDRLEENKRLAFSVATSTEFNNLSEEQQQHIRDVEKTGQL